jgi:hypothetical protein
MPISVSRDNPKPLDTAVPQVNFTVTGSERVNALVAGIPAWAARRRRIEDLDAEIRRDVALAQEKAGRALLELPPIAKKRLDAMNELIDKHNRYFPIEANLKFDYHTGRLLEGGEPWRPMPKRRAEEYYDEK